MTRTVKVDLWVPSDEWDAFVDHVYNEYGEIKGYVGREVERAMREWVDADEFAALEDRINRLIRAAGRRPVDAHEEKTLTDSAFDTEDLARVTCRVDGDVKAEFSAFVKQETDDRPGIGLARALRARRNGGRSARLTEKLDRVVDDAENLLEHVAGDGELSNIEQKEIAVCNELGEQFTRSELDSTIKTVADIKTDSYREEWAERILKRLDVTPHPNNHDLLIPTEQAEALAEETGAAGPSTPAIDRKPYQKLTRDEKIRGIQIELVRRAAKRSNGRYQFKTTQIREDVFDGGASANHARSLLKGAEGEDGFFVKTVGGSTKTALAVNVTDVRPALLEEAGVIEETPPPDQDDTTDVEKDVDEEFDELLSAAPTASATSTGG